MRLVFAARLSQLHDGETGLDTQEKEVIAWAEQHEHTIVGIAADHHTGKSNLWDRPQLRPWVTRPELIAQYDGIVAYSVDRLTRADDEGVGAMKDWARTNHKTILFRSAEVQFPSEGMAGGMWDLYIRMAHQEWLAIQERYKRMQAGKHDAGSLVGRAPWGYTIVKIGDIKDLEPTPEGRIWIPKIFGWAAEGWSYREIGEALKSAGVTAGSSDTWHEQTLARMIKCTTYSGLRERKGRTALTVEPLVSRALQDQAIGKLASRARLGRGGGAPGALPKALLAKLKCGHPNCPGEGDWPMYRVQEVYYRCTGKGAQRKGCGNPMIRVETLDNLVLNASLYWDTRPYVSQIYVSGNDAGVRLEVLRAEAADAMRVAPVNDWGTVADHYATRIKALEAEGSVIPHWEDVVTGQTEGEYLRSLDVGGQREYLGRKDIRAWNTGGVVHYTIDGVHSQSPTSMAGVEL